MRKPWLVLALALVAACDCGGGGTPVGNPAGGGGGGGGGSSAITEQLIFDFFDDIAPRIRAGAFDGFGRLLQFANGATPDGVSATPTGGNGYDIGIDMDLDGDGSRETTWLFPAQFASDPFDGLEDGDFPATVVITNQETPFGTYSANVTIEVLGGGATPSIFLVQGTSSLVSGSTVETSEFGYTADFTFPNIPLFGFEDISITSGANSATYEITYRFNTLGGQYTKVEGDVNGSTFVFEFGGTPQP